jgi:hypothetical protein
VGGDGNIIFIDGGLALHTVSIQGGIIYSWRIDGAEQLT